MTDRTVFLCAVGVYGISAIYSIFLLRRGFREDNRVNYLLLLGAFILHTLAMFQRGFSLQRCPINNLYEATMLIGWTIVTSYFVLGAFARFRVLGAFTAPLLFGLGVYAFILSLGPEQTPQPDLSGG